VLFRGNVATRLAKLEAGEADATLLAAAGLARLGMGDLGAPLDPTIWLPASAQGAIAIECRSNDHATRKLLASIDHAPSRAQVMAERALLAGLGGSCHSPVAVLCIGGGRELTLRAALFSEDGRERVEGAASFAAGDADGPAKLAAELLSRAPPSIVALFSGGA
jgi:hydroxymethylbilane synthase